MKSKTIVIIILIFFVVIFLIQNTQVVEVQLIFWKIAMSRVIMIAFSLIVGFIIGYFIPRIEKK
jgi:uncharacterized integral membrane protein